MKGKTMNKEALACAAAYVGGTLLGAVSAGLIVKKIKKEEYSFAPKFYYPAAGKYAYLPSEVTDLLK